MTNTLRLSRKFGFVIWGDSGVHYLGVRDREAANAGVASAEQERLSSSVVSEVSEEVTPPSRGTRPSRPSRGAGAGVEIVAAAARQTGQGERGRRAGPLPLPFPSVGPGGRPLVGPGGWARCLRTASGSAGPR